VRNGNVNGRNMSSLMRAFEPELKCRWELMVGLPHEPKCRRTRLVGVYLLAVASLGNKMNGFCRREIWLRKSSCSCC
jgi:hypothetical protein